MAIFTKLQWTVLILLTLSKFLSTILWSLQAPFFPREAEKKNATPLESGVVLGSYEIMVFIMCPIISTQIGKIGVFRCFHLGFVLSAVSTILFGFLDKIDGRIIFITLSLILRLFEAIGSSAVFLAVYALSNRLFPSNVATVFSILESTFAIGMAAGPPIGGLLFELGSPNFGYTTPFLTVGTTMLFLGILTFKFLPKDSKFQQQHQSNSNINGKTESTVEITKDVDNNDNGDETPNFGFFELLKVKKAAMYAIIGMCASICIGFLTQTLEPHLREEFELKPFHTGGVFLIYGGVYAATGFLWGILCDRIRRPEFATLIGSLMLMISFIFIGPVRLPIIYTESGVFISANPSLALTAASLVLFGLGLGGIYVSIYILILKEAKLNGFPESVKTSGLVAGLWMEGISLGAFIGPIVGGILYQDFGFRDATLFIIAIFFIVSVALSVLITCSRPDKTQNGIPKILITKSKN